MGGGPRRQPPPINCQNFYHAVLTFDRASLNVTTTAMTEKGRQLFGSRKVHPERENPGYANEKRAPHLTLVWGPQMVNPALLIGYMAQLPRQLSFIRQ